MAEVRMIILSQHASLAAHTNSFSRHMFHESDASEQTNVNESLVCYNN